MMMMIVSGIKMKYAFLNKEYKSTRVMQSLSPCLSLYVIYD